MNKFLMSLIVIFSTIISIQALANTGTSGKKNVQQASTATAALTPQQEVKELFDITNPRNSLTINGKVVQQNPNNNPMVRIFSGVSDSEVKVFFSKLGEKPLPAPRTIPKKGIIYTIPTSNGNLNLRDFATSQGQTGSVWTIDVPAGLGHATKATEIKFLR